VFGHSGDVKCVASSARSGTVVTASRDGSVRQWRLGEDSVALQIAAHTAHRGFVNAVLVTGGDAGDARIVSGGVDGALVVWATAQDAVRHEAAHSANVCALASLNDGTDGIVSGSWDHSAKLWRWTGARYELVRTFQEAATVWAVLSVSDEHLLTASADKAIRLYHPATGALLRTFAGAHADCVRALLAVPGVGFLSAGNDARICLWTLDGTMLKEFSSAAHSAYVYSLAQLDAGRFASSGEDKLVNVWSIDATEPLQTLRVPGSAWSVAPYRHKPRADFANAAPASELVDLMCASAEGAVHVFTTDAARAAPPALAANFAAAVEEAFAPPKRGGDIDVSRYPTRADGLRDKGASDGQNRIVQHEGLAEVWSWSAAADEWQHIGYAEGTADGGGGGGGADDSKMLNGVRYDFVFDVDIDAGAPLKLGYNHGQDPYTVAQNFIWQHQIDQEALPTVVSFIVRNTGAVIKASAASVDPLTRGRAMPDVLPVREFALFKAGEPAPMIAKALELHGAAHLSAPQQALLRDVGERLAQREHGLDAPHVELLVNILQWPTSALFPALDLVRVAMLRGVGGATLRSAVATALHRVVQELVASAAGVPAGLVLVATRTCANWIAAVASANSMAVDGGDDAVSFAAVARLAVQFVNALRPVTPSRNLALARASVLLNLGVLSLTHAFGDAVKTSCWSETQRALAAEKDADVQYSLLGALGTLLYRDVALLRVADAGHMRSVVAQFDSSNQAPKVQSITQELLELVSDLER
jgi:hypothetical protein